MWSALVARASVDGSDGHGAAVSHKKDQKWTGKIGQQQQRRTSRLLQLQRYRYVIEMATTMRSHIAASKMILQQHRYNKTYTISKQREDEILLPYLTSRKKILVIPKHLSHRKFLGVFDWLGNGAQTAMRYDAKDGWIRALWSFHLDITRLRLI